MKGWKVKKLHYNSYKGVKEKRLKRLAIIMITVLLFDMFIMPVGTFALDNENVTASEDQKTAATETKAVQEEETSAEESEDHISKDETVTDNTNDADVESLKDKLEEATGINAKDKEEDTTEKGAEEEETSASEDALKVTKAGDYSIEVTLDGKEKTGGSNFDLSVEEIKKGSKDWYKYFAEAEKTLGDGKEVSSARFFDVEILKDGKKYEPDHPAEVKIQYDDAIETKDREMLNVVHFAEDGTEIINDVNISGDGRELTYQQDSFSVTGTVVAKNNIQDGKEYVVYVASGGSYYAITHYSLGQNDDTVYGAQINGNTTTGATVSSDSVGSSIVWTLHTVNAGGRTWYTLSYKENGKTYYLRSYGGLMVGTDSDINENEYRNEARYQWEYDNEGRLWSRHSRENNQTGRYLRYSGSNGAFKERDNGSSRFYFAEVSSYTQDEVKTPTIHYVDEAGQPLEVKNGRNWEEDTTTSPAYLIYDIDGYEYVKTTMGQRFNSASEIKPIIRKAGSLWQYTTSNTTSVTWSLIPDADDIYVVYKKATEPVEGGTPKVKESSATEPPVDPVIHKGSESNGDGTNTLSLSITADTSPLEVEKLADVIVIFDTSTSMRRYMGTSTTTYNDNNTPASQCDHKTRLYIAAQAVNDLADMLIGDNTEFVDSGGNKLIRMSLISFDEDARLKKEFTDNYTDFSTAVNGLTTYTGTNWEAALEMANNMQIDDERATFVIFVTDGNPSYRVQRGNTLNFDGYPDTVSDANVDVRESNTYYYYRSTSNFGGLDENDVRNYNTAAEDAKSIVDHNKNLYSIGIGNSAGITRLKGLTSYAYDNEEIGADRTKTADNEEDLKKAFKDITASIVALLGWGDINMTDGITSLANTVEKSGLVNVEGSFEYWKAPAPEGWSEMTKQQRSALINNQNDPYVPDDSEFVRWNPASENCDEAFYDSTTGAVKWNMGHNFVPESGATYKVTFRVWPSQEAYDILANLKNGTMTYDSLPAEYKAQIVDHGNGSYSLRTNDKAPNTTYKAARKTGDGVTTTGDEKTLLFNNVEPMILVPEKIAVKKEWDHSINESHMEGDLKFRLKVNGKYYQNDGSFATGTENARIISITDEERTIDGETIPAWTNKINIAPGIIKFIQGDDGEVVEIYETGHNYELEEYDLHMHDDTQDMDESEFAGSYEFTTQTVRPMVLTSYAQSGDGKDYHAEHHADLVFLVLEDDYNPAPEGAEKYKIDGKTYFVKSGSETALVGTNHRKAELDITKIINDTTGKSEADLLKETFTYRVTLKVPKDANLSLITGYEFVYRPENPNITIHGYQEGDNPLQGDETRFRGHNYRWGTFSYGSSHIPLGLAFVDSGDGKTKTLTVDISLIGNEVLRFTNLPTGTTYTIEEVYANYKRANQTSDAEAIPSWDVPSNLAEQGYEVTTIRTSATGAEVKENNPETATLTASIDTPNKRYYNQFTNRLTNSVDAELKGTKHLKGYAWSGERYYFRLKAGQATYSDEGPAEPATSPMPEAARGREVFYLSNTSGTDDATYSFGDIRYTRPGTYKYTIREVASDAVDAATLSGTTGSNGIVYGPEEEVTVTVVRNASAKLVVQSIAGTHTTQSTSDGKAVGNTTITNERLVGDVTVLKIGNRDTDNVLKDVKFELYETYVGPGSASNVKAKNGITGEDIGTLTTGEDGKFVIQGLLPSTSGKTYYLVETDAAPGYIPLTAPVEIKLISKDEDPYYEVEYTQTGYADKVKVEPVDGILTITVNNDSGTELPHSGGSGVQAILMAGLLLIIAAAAIKGIQLIRNR